MTVPPTTDEVRVDRDGAVLTITLDRPADQNRLTREVLAALQGIADRLARRRGVPGCHYHPPRAEFFSMGILNPAVRASYTKEQILELVRAGNRLFDSLEALPQSSSPRSTERRARARRSWRSPATCDSPPPTRPSRCPRRSGAGSPAREGPFACPFILTYYNQRASNPAIAPRTDWLGAQQGQGGARRVARLAIRPTGPSR